MKEVRYDVLRREAVYRCDAYRPCGWRSDGETAPVEQQIGLFDVAGSGARSVGASPQEGSLGEAQLVTSFFAAEAAPRTRTGAHDPKEAGR